MSTIPCSFKFFIVNESVVMEKYKINQLLLNDSNQANRISTSLLRKNIRFLGKYPKLH